MTEENLTFGAALRVLTSESLDPHPEPEDLVALAEGRLSKSRASTIRSHLTQCEVCAQTVLDLSTFPEIEPRDPAKARTAAEEAQDWQSLRSRIASTPMESPLLFRRRPRPSFHVLALVAALLLTVVGFSIWISSLRRATDSSERPAANIYIRELTAEDDSGARAGSESISPPMGTERVLFILALRDLQPWPRVQAEIVDEKEAVVWRREGLIRMPDGSFTLELPGRYLPPGAYRIHLAAVETSGTKTLATYTFHLSATTLP